MRKLFFFVGIALTILSDFSYAMEEELKKEGSGTLFPVEEIIPKEDEHDKHLAYMVGQRHFSPQHFGCCCEEDNLKEVKIFDIQKVHEQCACEIHKKHLERLPPTPSFPPSSSLSFFNASLTYIGNGFTIAGKFLWYPFTKKQPSTPPLTNSVTTTEGQSAKTDIQIEPKSSQENQPEDLKLKGVPAAKTFSVLSIDGGGIRGFGPALLIEYLEKETNEPVWKLFDQASGTSIGGILTLGLTMPKNQGEKEACMTGADLVNLFTKEASLIFPQAASWNIPAHLLKAFGTLFYARHSPEYLEKSLQKHLGGTMLGNALTHTMVTTVDPHLNQPYFLDSLNTPTCFAWEAGRGSSAAPTYFPGCEIQISLNEKRFVIDGGIACNNPAFEALMNMKAIARLTSSPFTFDQVTVLSLGTGSMPFTPIPNNAGILKGVGPIIEACMQTQVNGVDMTLREVLKENKTYFRLNPKIDHHISLDDLSEKNMEILLEAAQSQFGEMDKFIASDAMHKRLESLN